jgi:hypothetical protein
MLPIFWRGRVAVAGALAVGAAIAFSSFSVVLAERAKPDKSAIYNCNSGTACVEGRATGRATYGVYGVSSVGDAVYGQTSNGIGVWGNSTNAGPGVYGLSSTPKYPGVEGKSTGSVGVGGTSTVKAGVEGTASANSGVYGISTAKGFPGVRGQNLGTNNGGYGGIFESSDTSGNGVALVAEGHSPSTNLFYAYSNTSGGGFCSITAVGDLTCSGTISGGSSLRVRQPNSSGQHVLAYAPEATSATIEDVGEARLIGGRAIVRFDRDFASTIDRNVGYLVFLTPMGDTRGLYVRLKTPAGFEVRETQGGRSSLLFDYRIVARPLGANSDRLPLAPLERRKYLPMPSSGDDLPAPERP